MDSDASWNPWGTLLRPPSHWSSFQAGHREESPWGQEEDVNPNTRKINSNWLIIDNNIKPQQHEHMIQKLTKVRTCWGFFTRAKHKHLTESAQNKYNYIHEPFLSPRSGSDCVPSFKCILLHFNPLLPPFAPPLFRNWQLLNKTQLWLHIVCIYM